MSEEAQDIMQVIYYGKLINMSTEIWKPIIGHENYEVSNLGNVKSLKKDIILKYRFHHNGYASIALKRKNYLVHRLVAKAFLENLEGKTDVNHKNCIKSDNRLENLEWVNKKENIQHALNNNRILKRYGLDNPLSKKIKQLSKEGNLIKIWDSLSDVKRELKIDVKCLIYCCKKRKGIYLSKNKLL